MDPFAGRPEKEHEQLLRTIGTLEAQRSVLGDSAVDLVLGPVRTRLAEFDGSGTGPDPPDLRSEHKVVTVVLVDVSGFTAMSEQLESEEVRDIVNGLFERLVPVVERYGGVIDKFMGDEIMALFGAPRATEHHADHALRASLDMFEEALFSLPWKISGQERGANSHPRSCAHSRVL
jgi:class 3 adenylate cyclase